MIYITGDTHGDPRRLSAAALSRLRENDTLIVCGDFGFIWDGSARENRLLRELGSRKYHICFLDGTHENFELLNAYPEQLWRYGAVRVISGNLRYLKRGELYHMEGKKVFVMGGGESPDMEMRQHTAYWSRDEMPSREDLYRGLANLEKNDFTVDLILTHEPAQKTKEFLSIDDGAEPRFTALNAYLDEIRKVCTFDRWFFGSMHRDVKVSPKETAVFQAILNASTGERLYK